MNCKPYGDARVSVASDVYANNPETKRRALSGCEEVFEDMPGRACLNWPGLNRLKQAVAPGDFIKVAELDRLGPSVTEALGSLGGLRQKQVEVISVRESIDVSNPLGRAMLQLAVAFAKVERRPAREKTLVKLERAKATGDGPIYRQGTQGATVGHLRERGCRRDAAILG